MFTTSMFNWAGIPNSIQNITTVPGIVIRGTKLAIGQTAGKAAQTALKSSESKKD
jgi:filamentous hemagglutinin